MKKILKVFIAHPMLIVLVVIVVFYLPASLALAPEGLQRQHVASIGIDSVGDKVEVSLLSYFSTESQGFKENYLFVSAVGDNVPSAIRQIEINSGREVALTHTTVIVVSQALAENGLEKHLDYFYRDDTVSKNAHLICTKSTAKEVLKYEQQMVNTINVGLEELSLYNSQSVLFTDINLESFYKGYFSQVNASIVGLLETEDGEKDNKGAGGSSSGDSGSSGGSSGNSGSSGGSSGDSGGESSSPTDLQIKSFDEVLVLKGGKAKFALSRDDIKGMNFLNPRTRNVVFEVNDIKDNFYDDVDITFRVERNAVKRKGYFENGIPVFEANILLQVSIDELKADILKPAYYSNKQNLFTEAVVKAIEAEVKGAVRGVFEKCKQNSVDVLGIFSVLHDNCSSRFLKWYDNLPTPADFLSHITFKISITPTLTI